MKYLLCLAASSVLLSVLPGQNLLKNGDFSANSSGTPTHWTQQFYLPGSVASFATDGGTANNGFAVTHGKKVLTGSGAGDLSQAGVLVIKGLTYEVRADIAVGGSFNNDPGAFEILVDGVSVGKVDFKASRGSKPAGTVFRERMCLRFVATKSNTKAVFTMRVSRQFLAATNRTPVAYVDNLFLGRVAGPTICAAGERIATKNIPFTVTGRASSPFIVWGSPQLLKTAIRIPNWGGQFELAAPVVTFQFAKTDAQGVYRQGVRTVAVLKGFGLHFQAAEAVSASVVNFGYPQYINLY